VFLIERFEEPVDLMVNYNSIPSLNYFDKVFYVAEPERPLST
jgi:hypothetical protein